MVSGSGFEIICEIEPPARPDLGSIRERIAVLAPVASAYLIPDNHLGRAAVSSVAVAHEIASVGGRNIVCLNARDRNLLGLRRDLLTAAAYGVTEFVFVHGDRPTAGARTGDLTVPMMIDEARRLDGDPLFDGVPPLRIGVSAGRGRLPGWKRAADFVFAQISFDVGAALRWRDAAALDVPVHAGVMVLASPVMARRLAVTLPDIGIPAALIERLDRDPLAGVAAAEEQIGRLRASGAFDGIHLVAGSRYREIARRLSDRRRPGDHPSGP